MYRINLFATILLLPFLTFAQPSNDEICDAIFILPSDSCNFQTFDNIGATGSFVDTYCYAEQDHDVWFKTIVPPSGKLVIQTQSNQLNRAVLMVYQGDSCGNNLNFIECSGTNSTGGMPSLELFNLNPGEELYLRIFDYYAPAFFIYPEDPYEFGQFDLCIRDVPENNASPINGNCSSVAAGDDCSNATVICSLNGYCGSTDGYNDNAWSGLESPFCGSIENNSFLKYEAVSDTMSINVVVDGDPSDCPTGIQFFIFTTTSCGSGTVTDIYCQSPINIGSWDYSFGGLTIGEDYYIMIDGYAGDICNYSIDVDGLIGNGEFEIFGSKKVCAGDTIELNASSNGSGTVNWTGPNLINNSGQTAFIAPSSPGTYTYIAEAIGFTPLCGSNIDTFVVEVIDNYSSFTSNVSSQSCSSLHSIQVTTNSTNVCNWISDGLFSEVNEFHINAQTTTTEEYVLIVSDTNGCYSKETITIVPGPNSIDTNVIQVSNSLEAMIINTNYQWLDCDNGHSAINGETFQSFSPSVSGNYALRVESGTCIDTSNCHFVNTTICLIDTSVVISQTSLISNQNMVNYQWVDCNNSNAIIPGETNQIFNPTQSGNYAVIVQNGNCTDTSNCHEFLTCNIDTSINRVGQDMYTDYSGASYQWVNCDNGYSFVMNETGLYFSPTQPGNYALIIDNGNCIDTSSCHNVTLSACGFDTSVVQVGQSLRSTHYSINYQWVDCNNAYSIIASETDQFFYPAYPGYYAVILNDGSCTDTSYCHYIDPTFCGFDTSVIAQNEFLVANENGVNYQWIDCSNNYAIIPNATNKLFNPPVAGNYAVILDNGSCIDTSQCLSHDGCNDLMINVTNAVQPTLGSADGEIEFVGYGGTPAYSYLWNDGNTDSMRTQLDTGAYTVSILDIESCAGDRILYLYGTDTSFTANPPIDTLNSAILDVCIPFTFVDYFVYDYYPDGNGDLIVRWAFVGNNNETFIQIVNYGPYPFPNVGQNVMITINIDCQNGSDNNKALETYKAFIFVRGNNSHIGVSENNIFNVSIFPNPTKNFINYKLDQTKGEYEILLIDAKGKLLSKEKSSAQEGQLNLDLESGIYYVHFAFEQSLVVKKIVKL